LQLEEGQSRDREERPEGGTRGREKSRGKEGLCKRHPKRPNLMKRCRIFEKEGPVEVRTSLTGRRGIRARGKAAKTPLLLLLGRFTQKRHPVRLK